MPRRHHHLLLALAMFIAGCASATHRSAEGVATESTSPPTTAATTQPADPKSLLTLKEMEPVPQLATPATPATQPTTRPALDALELYGKARDAMTRGQRYTAITLLEKAIAIDPDSYNL